MHWVSWKRMGLPKVDLDFVILRTLISHYLENKCGVYSQILLVWLQGYLKVDIFLLQTSWMQEMVIKPRTYGNL